MLPDDALLERVKAGRFLIAGEWRDADESHARFQIVRPSDEQVFATVPCARAEDVAAAVNAARDAFDNGPWPRLSHAERGQFLYRLADALEAHAELSSQLWSNQVGGLLGHARLMAGLSVSLFRDYAKLATEFDFVERHAPTAGGMAGFLVHEPVGVVGVIIPWNAPGLMLASKLGPALLAGCTVVVKMSAEAPLEGVLLGEILQELGLPPGVVNIIMADRAESELLVQNPAVDKISFTGSTAVGQRVGSICGGRVARATLELGGKSAAVVLNDAPVELVADALLPQFSMLSMQFCSALSRVIVPQQRHDAVLEALAAGAAKIQVGDPFDPASQMGPMSMRRQLDRVNEFLAGAQAEGLQPATGGDRPAGLNGGFYIRPTVFGGVPNDARIAREEIFGPVLCVIPARDEEHAVALANDTPFGLNNSIFTQDVERAVSVSKKLRSGTVGHNALRSDFGIAFGGFKKSGIGREGGRAGLMHYLESKTVILESEPETAF